MRNKQKSSIVKHFARVAGAGALAVSLVAASGSGAYAAAGQSNAAAVNPATVCPGWHDGRFVTIHAELGLWGTVANSKVPVGRQLVINTSGETVNWQFKLPVKIRNLPFNISASVEPHTYRFNVIIPRCDSAFVSWVGDQSKWSPERPMMKVTSNTLFPVNYSNNGKTIKRSPDGKLTTVDSTPNVPVSASSQVKRRPKSGHQI
jgi:hypothetical protein